MSPLSESDRTALRAHWLSGDPLPAPLCRALRGRPRSDRARARQAMLLAYLDGLGDAESRRVRRLVLAYAPAAIARLVELMDGENAETSRKAAVDLLRYYTESLREERDEAARDAANRQQRLAGQLTDEQVGRLLAILAEAGDASPASS